MPADFPLYLQFRLLLATLGVLLQEHTWTDDELLAADLHPSLLTLLTTARDHLLLQLAPKCPDGGCSPS